MANNRDTKVKISLIDGVTAGLKRIRGGLGEVAGSLGGLKGLAVGVAGAFAGWQIGKGIVSAISDAAALEAAMARVGAVAGVTGERLGAMQDRIQASAQATKVTTLAAAQTVEELARAGLSAEDALGALEPTLNLARTAALSTQEAANLLADTLDQFGLAGSEAATVADTLAAAALSSGTGVGQLAAGLTKVSPVARAVGLDLQTTAAALGLMARNGIEGGKAGAALATVLDDIRDPTSKFSKALKEAGITSTDFGTIISQLAAKGDGASGALNSLSLKGRSALEALMREGGGNLRELAAQLQQSGGAAEGAANQIENTFSVAWENLKARWTDIKTDLAEPILAPLADALTDLADQLIAFSKTAEFDTLKQGLADIFTAGIENAREFLSAVDWSTIATDIATFAKEAGANLREFADEARELGESVETFFDGIKVATSGFETGWNALKLGGVRVAEFVTRIDEGNNVVGQWNKSLRDTAIAIEDDLGRSIDDTSAAMDDFEGVADAAGTATERMGDKAAGAAEETKKLADFSNVVVGEANKAAGALDAMGKAAETDSTKLKATSSEAGKLAVEIGKLNAQIAARIAAGESFADLIPSLNKAEEKLASLGNTGAETGDKITKGQDSASKATEKTATAAEAAGDGMQQAAQGADAANASMAEGERLAGSYSGGVMGLITGLNQFFGGISENARQYFVEVERSAVKGSLSMEGWIKNILRAEEQTLRALSGQKTGIEGAIAAYDELARTGSAAARGVSAATGQTAAQLDEMAANVGKGIHGFKLLNESDTSRLQASIQAAADKVRALEERTDAAVAALEDYNNNLQDQIDRNAGNEEALARREYESRLRDIEKLSREGGKAAEAAAAAARRRAELLYREELERIENAKNAKIAADTQVDETRRTRNNQQATTAPTDSGSTGGGGQGRMTQGSASSGGFGPAQQPVTFNFTGWVGSEDQLARKVRGMFDDYNRQRR
jgi:TP901 family phage tail tape measure protein